MAVVALDLGRRRIGLAIAQGAAMGAHPMGTILRRSAARDFDEIRAKIAGRDVTRLIVGLPLNMGGSEGVEARRAAAFAARLAEALGLPVEMFDERLTSVEAEERLRGVRVGRARRKPAVDALAATIILEGWLETHAVI